MDERSRWTSRRCRSSSPGSSSASTPRPGARCAARRSSSSATARRPSRTAGRTRAATRPRTIAAQIAGLVAAADIARRNGAAADAARYERIADRWANTVQRWTATTTGPYSDEQYYLRLTKDRRPDRGTRYEVGDGGPKRADQRNVVDPSFLELVRLGIKRVDDPVILNTLEVVDQRLRTHDAERRRSGTATPTTATARPRTGGPWSITEPGTRTTFGRVWPIFAGERGEYELLAGRPPTPTCWPSPTPATTAA